MPKAEDVKYLVWHCSATKSDQDIGYEEIRYWHVDLNGWSDIGYAFIVRRDGSIELGRDLDKDGDVFEEIGAHVKGFNSVSVGMCWVGGYDGIDNRTEAQKRTMKSITKMMHVWYPKAIIQGHNDFPNVKKSCPSFDIKKWLIEIGIN